MLTVYLLSKHVQSVFHDIICHYHSIETQSVFPVIFCQLSSFFLGTLSVFHVIYPVNISLLCWWSSSSSCVSTIRAAQPFTGYHSSTGAQSVLTYATVSSHIIGWDLRSSSPAWTLRNDPRQGLLTSLAVNRSQCWLAVGTCTGVVQCWDMRFRMPINKIQHPSGRRVRRVTMHPSEQSWLVASFNWNNEVTMLDAETGQRQKTLWPSPSPPLSYSKVCVQ